MVRVLGRGLKKLKCPGVLGEIAAGILLGPSIMGHVPGFSATIFPVASRPPLSLVSNIGLILFMAYLGMELDYKRILAEWRVAIPVAAAAIVTPFCVGLAAASWLYEVNNLPHVDYTSFALFLSASFSFTAFPVLASILRSTKMVRSSSVRPSDRI